MSIDSLTSSIQCTSSITKSAGVVRESVTALINAVRRRRRASGSITGPGYRGIGNAKQIIKEKNVFRVGVGHLSPYVRARRGGVEFGDS